MGIYIILIAAILLISILATIFTADKEKREKTIAAIGMLLIFLLLALKAETVGIDIPGYREAYELSRYVSWENWDYGHYEKGYVALMMIFSKLGLSFQVFTAFLYAVWCCAIYLLIRKYSTNATLSLIIFLCYQFFVLSISGLRQMLAMAICIFALIMCLSDNKKLNVCSLLLVVVAYFMHRSAVVFFAIPVAVWLFRGRVHIAVWAVLFTIAFVFKGRIWSLLEYIMDDDYQTISFGGNFIFQIGIAAFVAVTYLLTYHPLSTRITDRKPLEQHISKFDPLVTRCAFMCLISFVAFSVGSLLRANMYFTLILIPGIPYCISRYEPKTRMALNAAMAIFVMVLFYTDTLVPNQLLLCPYRFFWQ